MAVPEEHESEQVTNPEAAMKALELELMAKRAAWSAARARRGRWRALSLLFLFLVIFGALLAYFFFATEMHRRGGETPAAENVKPDR